MYSIEKRMEIAGSHSLSLDYDSKCTNMHCHNWVVTLFCRTEKLDHNGMVADFTLIKQQIHDKLDHQHIF